MGTNYSALDCSNDNTNSNYHTNCGNYPSGFSEDYWAGATIACKIAGMRLPTKEELYEIYTQKDELGIPTSGNGFFWSSSEYNESSATVVSLDTGQVGSGDYKGASMYKLLCVEL